MSKKLILGGITGIALLGAGLFLRAAAPFDPNDQPVGYVAQPGITSFNLTSNQEHIFRTDFRRSDWSGNLLKVPVTANGLVVEVAEDWSGGAAVQLDAQSIGIGFDTNRKIATLSSDGTRIPFRWTSLSPTQQAAIGDATSGPRILNYVRGDRSNEAPDGAAYRERRTVLGPLIHSTPRHHDYAELEYGRVFVGGNDGMLHAFDADTGVEVFAYVPSMLIPNLKKLVADPYTLQHYVDGNVTSEPVRLNGAPGRILVGGLGAGGRGLYALDVTTANPANEAALASMILWEKTNASAGFTNLGYTYGTPRVARVRSGAGSAEAVLVNNGYASTTGLASLFILDAANGALIREISTGSGSTASPNGLSSVRLVDRDGDAIVDVAYAGDLDGQLWKFDLSSTSAASWTATKLFTTSPAQAITVAPAAQAHPDGGYMVMFATGRMLSAADSTDASVHYAYGFWDGAPASNTTLITQSLTETGFVNGTMTTRVRIAASVAPNWAAGGNVGWKTPLPGGERVLGDGTFFEGGRFYFASTNPTITAPSGVVGENWLNQLDYLSGGAPGGPFFNLNGDGVVDDKDRVNGDLSPQGVAVSKELDPGLGSQPVLASLAVLDITLFTFNPDVLLPPPPMDRGVAGGHFDVDIYYGNCPTKKKGSRCWQVLNQKHFHEYDDIFDVTGVNFLNASSPTLNLEKAIPSTTTPFKVLAYNQYHSPAVKFAFGGVPYTDIRKYRNPFVPEEMLTSLDFKIANLPQHTRANVSTMLFNLPLDAFTVKDWAGDGDPRVGLIPTQPGCVRRELTEGRLGEARNGAITWQVVKSDTPQSALRLNVAGRPDLGWRVKDDLMPTYVLAEYTVYWHHPNGLCYTTAQTAWTAQAAPDTSEPDPSRNQTPAAGSTDPKEGSFQTGEGSGFTSTVIDDNVTTITTVTDTETRTEVRTTNPDESTTVVVTTCAPVGTGCTTVTTLIPAPKSFTGTGGLQKGSPYGRMSWRDLE